MNFDIDPRDINLQGPDGMQLVKLLRGLIEEIDSGGDVPVPVIDSEIFYCTYNQTSGTEISQALSNGLLPVCKYNTKVYYLVSTVPPYTFVSFDRTNYNMYLLTCIGTTWSMPIRYLQERLEFDYTPTQGSTNPVTSGGVWAAIQQGGGGSDIDPYQQYPEMDGVASPGNSDDYARGNHVHPTDTSRAAASEITRIDAALATKADAATMEQDIEDAVDDWMTAQAPSIGTLSYAAKQALLACLRKVAWIDDQGQSYYNALESELFPDATLESISAVFTQGSATIYDTDSLDILRQYLVVTATFSDSTTETVTGYTLSGTLSEGTSTITVSYGGKTTTFTVTVTGWDFEWYATSGSLPAGFNNSGVTWGTNNEYANIKQPIYQIPYSDIDVEFEVAWLTIPTESQRQSMQIIFSNAAKYATKMYSPNNTNNVQFVTRDSGGTGNSFTLNNYASTFHRYRVISQGGHCYFYIDGELRHEGYAYTSDYNFAPLVYTTSGTFNDYLAFKFIRWRVLS